MDKIVIQGGRPLRGSVAISGAKNAVLPVLAATLLTHGKNRITHAPEVRDVDTMLDLIGDLGGVLDSRVKGDIVLDTANIKKAEARYDLVATMRASCLVLGPLMARLGEARVSLPGGCAIGARPIDLHIKGLEAMVVESFTAARRYGVEDEVVASLAETFPGIDWERQAAYFFQRVIEHGRRRAEEMREVAQTVREAGLDPWSAAGSAERQAWVADLADTGVFGARGKPGFARSADWRTEADRILARIAGPQDTPPPEDRE